MDLSQFRYRNQSVDMCFMVNGQWRIAKGRSCISVLRNLCNRELEWLFQPAFKTEEIERIGVRVDTDVSSRMLDYLMTAPQYGRLFTLEDNIFNCAVDTPVDVMVNAFRTYINFREFPITLGAYDYLLDNGIDKDVAFIVASSTRFSPFDSHEMMWSAGPYAGHNSTKGIPHKQEEKAECLRLWRAKRPTADPYNNSWEYSTIADYVTDPAEAIQGKITDASQILEQAIAFQ